MAKEVLGKIKLEIPAGKANPAPPIGPALGQRGLNIMEFCKAFNAATQALPPGEPTPVVITAYKDKSFEFICKTPPVPFFLKQAAGIQKASQEPGKKVAGKVTRAQILEIAKKKIKDMNANDLDAACSMIAGTAVSMGLRVEE